MFYKKYINEYENRLNNNYSDLLHSTDEIMYSNTKALELYGYGKRFNIEDNLIFYEVIKVVKDIIDKHFYSYQIKFNIQIANNSIELVFIIDKIYNKYNYFIETLFMIIKNQIYNNFKDMFNILREDEILEDNKILLRIKIIKNKEK